MTIYALGDIHGQQEMLDTALGLIADDGGAEAEIVFVGDYTDRGLNSRSVVETLMHGVAAGKNWHLVKGNHDRGFTRFVRDATLHDPRIVSGVNWLNPRMGGTNTLASYGVTADQPPTFSQRKGEVEQLAEWLVGGENWGADRLSEAARVRVPEEHLAFLETLPLTFETEDLLFVHAGIRPGIAMADQDPEDLLWIRDGWLEDTRDHGKLVVHGHTALDYPQHHGNRVNLDGGAGYGRPLVPAVFEGRDCWLLTDKGRVPLTP